MDAKANRSTPLFDLHQALGAKFVEFAGWQMPLQYKGILAEHHAVRSHAGIFDVSHMAKWQITGEGSATLQKLVLADLTKLRLHQSVYTLLLNEQGGIMDDVIVYCGADGWWLISNAATYSKLGEWLSGHLGLCLRDLMNDQVLLAVQGRGAIADVQKLVSEDLGMLPKFHHIQASIFNTPALVARTGYTGEDGLEIMLSPEQGRQLWQNLVDLGVTPCGLGSRDTLRLEAGLHLYGQDMDETTTPYSAGLGWMVDLHKHDFVGRTALLSQTEPHHKLVGLMMQGRAIARHDYPIERDGKTIGRVTSGTMSPTLNQAIALGYVQTDFAKLGQTVAITIRNQPHMAVVSKRSFYRLQSNP